MAPPLSYMMTASLLLSSFAYFTMTLRHMFSGPGSVATIQVQINDGPILGLKKISRAGRAFYDFRGIPYATQPRDGYLRFEPPIPPKPWIDTLDATKYGAFCLQYEVMTGVLQGDEPCLYLNVATPKVLTPKQVKTGTSKLFPVIVYLYGGGFMSGFSNVYNPSYFMDENVVLVSLNYRVGVFGEILAYENILLYTMRPGFLNTGDGVVNGNQGLKDQVLALKWVRDNIMFFGGDPSSVTLMGQSAGGASVHLHTLSPMSKGLFHRAISQSGNALNYFALCKKPREQALKVGRLMNCPTNDTRQMVDCLKSKPALELNKVNKEYIDLLSPRSAFFAPTVEEIQDDNTAFLTDKPANLIRQGKVNRVPLIVGSNTNDGLFFSIILIQDREQSKKLNGQWETYAPKVFDYEDETEERRTNISRSIWNFYLGNRTWGWDTVVETGTMISDRFFLEGIYDTVRLQANVTPVYPYQFRYKGDFSLASLLFHMTSFLPKTLALFYSISRNWFSKTILRQVETRMEGCHLDEIPLFFHLTVISKDIIPGTVDYPMSDAAIKLWTSFARNGKPDKLFGVEWDPVSTNASSDPDSIKYLKFDDQPSMINESFRNRIEFWKSLDLEGRMGNNNELL